MKKELRISDFGMRIWKGMEPEVGGRSSEVRGPAGSGQKKLEADGSKLKGRAEDKRRMRIWKGMEKEARREVGPFDALRAGETGDRGQMAAGRRRSEEPRDKLGTGRQHWKPDTKQEARDREG